MGTLLLLMWVVGMERVVIFCVGFVVEEEEEEEDGVKLLLF